MSKTGTRWLTIGSGLAALALGLGLDAPTSALCQRYHDGENAAYPALRSRVYYAEVAQAMTAAEQALRRLPRWKLVTRDGENDALDAEVRTPVGPFTDDVTVYFFPLGHGQTRVTIRSRSRLGRGDLSQNAAHIRELQNAMDDRLNAGAAF